MQKIFSKVVKTVLFCVPFILCMYGLVILENQPILNSAFSGLCMYFLNYQDSPANILVELARWTAPIATTSGILMAFAAIREKIRDYIIYRRGSSVAVYGSGEEKDNILLQLGKNGIDGNEDFVMAERYILTGPEEENFAFYRKYKDELAGSTVYLQSSSLQAQAVSDPHLRLFCPEETAARLFWKEKYLYPLSIENKHNMKIVIIGFGKLGEEVLTFAIQNNIFSPEQYIEYHIFGDGKEFSAIHPQLSEIEDKIIFRGDSWYEDLQLIENAQAVIVLTQDGQISLLKDLLLATTRREIDVFAADVWGISMLSGAERLKIFDWKSKAQNIENILSDTMYERAKKINLRYAALYSGVEESEKEKEIQWQKLNSFTRYSNVSSADYHEVRLKMLQTLNEPDDAEKISPDTLELLSELEHIRWNRYHYLNNWRYGICENGKRKDTERRIHSDLVPYSSLTEGEKEKDRENIRVLLSIK